MTLSSHSIAVHLSSFTKKGKERKKEREEKGESRGRSTLIETMLLCLTGRLAERERKKRGRKIEIELGKATSSPCNITQSILLTSKMGEGEKKKKKGRKEGEKSRCRWRCLTNHFLSSEERKEKKERERVRKITD